MTRHCVCVDVRGVLEWPDRDLAGMFVKSSRRGTTLSADEAREHLRKLDARGIRFLPVGEACDAFDAATGCAGHANEVPPKREVHDGK